MRHVLIAVAGFAIAVAPMAAQGQSAYPTKNIRVIVPSPTGGPSDLVARILGDRLSTSLGKTIIVDNRPGASQIVGTAVVAKAAPDGYTLLQAAANLAVPELLKFIRANPAKITYGVTGPGSPQQLATLLLAQMAGGLRDMTEVKYKGSPPAHPDLIANRISFMIDPLAAAAPHVKAGSLRALAVSTPQRNPSFPDVPTAAESGVPGYDFSSWGGILAPAGMPRAVVQKLNAEIGVALSNPDLTRRFVDMGLVAKHSTPEEFGKFVQSEMTRWRVVMTKKP